MRDSQGFWNRKLRASYLGSRLLRFINVIVRLFQNSMIGHFFRSDERTDMALEASAISGSLEIAQFEQRVRHPAKRRLLMDSEKSRFLRFFEKLTAVLIRTPAKAYGFFLFAAGFFTIVFTSVTHIYETADPDFLQKIIVSAVCIILSFPFFRMEEPIHLAIQSSLLLSSFFHDFCGIQKSEQEVYTFPFQEYLALLLGVGFGCMLSLLHYQMVLLLLALLVFFAITVTKPEVGTILCLFTMPLLPAKALAILLVITTLSFVGKIMIGKRALHNSLLDINILFLALILQLSTAFGAVGFLPSHFFAIPIFLAIYFLVSNLLDSAEWLTRGMLATLFGISIAAILGIIEYITGNASALWQDATLFNDLAGRAGSTLGNPNMLATILVLTLPLILACTLFDGWQKSWRALASLAFLMSACCLVLTWSRGGWLGAVVAMIVFLLLYTRKTWIFLLSAALLSPVIALLLPDMIVRRLASILNFADSSTSYRMKIWEQSLQMIKDHFFGGIGYGEEAFSAMAAQHPIAGLTAEAHAHSLYLQLILSAGIFALLLLLVFAILLTRKILTFHKLHASSSRFPYRTVACAAFSGVIGFFVQSATDHTWYSYRVFCIFWAIVGISIAAIRSYNHFADYTTDAQSTYTIDIL